MPMTRFSIIITSHNQREFIKDVTRKGKSSWLTMALPTGPRRS
jgi:hypothetical protein